MGPSIRRPLRMPINPLVKSVSIVALTIAAATTVAAKVPQSGAYFSSTASMGGNHATTDIIKVELDHGPKFTPPMDYMLAPGASYAISTALINKSQAYPIQAYVSVKDEGGSDPALWANAVATIRESNIGNGTLIYQGPLSELGVKPLVDANGHRILILPGQESAPYYLAITVPENGQDQSALMGKEINFSWAFTGEAGAADLTQN
jgi:hypothetical protein